MAIQLQMQHACMVRADVDPASDSDQLTVPVNVPHCGMASLTRRGDQR